MMMSLRFRVSTCFCVAILLSVTTAALALAPEPEEQPEPGAAAAGGAPAAARQPPAARRPAAAEETPAPMSPAVAAVAATSPKTLLELVRAAKIMSDFDRPDLAKKYLQQLLAAKPNEQQLAELGETIGSPTFVALAERKDVQPEGKQLSDAVLAAVNKQLRDPQRLAKLIRQLQDPSAEIRYQALSGLRDAHGAAVAPLLAVLADPARTKEYASVRAALVQLGGDAVGPLRAALESPDPRLVAQVIQVIGEMGQAKSAVYLLGKFAAAATPPEVRAAAGEALTRLMGHLPSSRESAQILTHEAKLHFDSRQPIDGAIGGRVEVWTWDAAKKEAVARNVSVTDASRAIAVRLARDAYAVAPDDQQVRLLYLTTMLEQAKYSGGLDKTLPDAEGSAAREAAGFGAATIENVLQSAMASGHAPAATAAAEILGRSGQTQELLYRGTSLAPLVQAAQSPDRRLRLAAVEAIVRLQPARSFPGASCVPEALAYFAASAGGRRALAAAPTLDMARESAGMLTGAGLETDTAVTGRELMRKALASPDYELALIDAAIDQPTIDLLIQQLRRDCRTAGLRVAIIARDGYFDQAERVARRYANTMSFARPHAPEAFRWQMDQLATLSPQQFVGQKERQRQAAAALDMLATLSGSQQPQRLYDLRPTQAAALAALYNPALSLKAIAVLGNLGTPEGQRALVELASRATQPAELRKAAIVALSRSVERRGILLTTDEISRQYDLYNQSDPQDPAARPVLGLILDCLEAPTQTVGGKR